MFIDLVKAINVIKRPGYIKIVKYCGILSFLPLNPSVRIGAISSFFVSLNKWLLSVWPVLSLSVDEGATNNSE